MKLLTVSKRFQLKKLNFLVNQTKYGDNRKPKENIQNPCKFITQNYCKPSREFLCLNLASNKLSEQKCN